RHDPLGSQVLEHARVGIIRRPYLGHRGKHRLEIAERHGLDADGPRGRQESKARVSLLAAGNVEVDEQLVADELIVSFRSRGGRVLDAQSANPRALPQTLDQRLRELPLARPVRGLNLEWHGEWPSGRRARDGIASARTRCAASSAPPRARPDTDGSTRG